MGVDVDEVVDGVAQDDRIGSHFFRPGIGYGGSCLPKDTAALRYMGEATGVPTPFLSAVQQVNDYARTRTVRRLREALGSLDRKRIAVWGLTFKGDTEDTRQSPATEVVQLLVNEGAEVVAFDPSQPTAEHAAAAAARGARARRRLDAVDDADALAILTDWREFADGTAGGGRGADARRPGPRRPQHARSRRLPSRRACATSASVADGAAPPSGGPRMKVMVAGGAGFVGSHLSRACSTAGTPCRRRGRPLDRAASTTSPTCSATRGSSSSSADVAHTPAHPRRCHRPPGVAGQPGRLRPHAGPHHARQRPGHVPLARCRHATSARVCCSSRRRRSTAIRWSTPSRRPTGATWTRSDRAPATTRPSASARRCSSPPGANRASQANIVRLFNTYGPAMRRDDGRVIPEMVSAALAGRPLTVHGNGSQTRSFCYVSDLVAGLEPRHHGRATSTARSSTSAIRTRSPCRELAEHILEATGSSSELHFTSARPGDPERRRPIIDKIQSTATGGSRASTARWYRPDHRGLQVCGGARTGPYEWCRHGRVVIPIDGAIAAV